jgi:hypothetical protein
VTAVLPLSSVLKPSRRQRLQKPAKLSEHFEIKFLLFSRVARFFLVQHTKMEKYNKITIKYTQWPQNIPNGHKIYQHLLLQDPPKFTQIGNFCLKICHLATLLFTLLSFPIVAECTKKDLDFTAN